MNLVTPKNGKDADARLENMGLVQEAGFEGIGLWVSTIEQWLKSIVFDTFHFWRRGCDLSQIEAVPGGRISLVHLNDVNDVPPGSATDGDRTYPGEGIMPLKEILGGPMRNGFTGAFDVEIFGQVQGQDPREVSVRSCQTARKLMDEL